MVKEISRAEARTTRVGKQFGVDSIACQSFHERPGSVRSDVAHEGG